MLVCKEQASYLVSWLLLKTMNPILFFTISMAELNGTSEALPLDNSHIAREATANEDTLMRDGEATPLTREPPTAKPLTETQQPADTHGTQTAPMTAPSTEAPISEMPPPAPSTPSLAAPEGFTADDLAMQRNPMITADASMVDSESIRDAVQPPPDYSQHEENTCVPEIPQETSVTGWLVPPPESEASTLAEPTTSTKPSIPAESSPSTAIAATRQSRISFEGASSSFVSIHLLIPHFNSIQYEIETFLQLKRVFPHLIFWDSDYLTLSEITFEWGDSYDDKDWMRLRAILAPTLMVKALFPE